MTVATPSASALTAFQYHQTPVRTVERSGSPWFVAVDIAASLGIKNIRESVAKLDDDEKATVGETYGSGGARAGRQDIVIVSESGLYTLILRSNKPEAKKFRRWVTGEVLPAIRRHGSYDAKLAASIDALHEGEEKLKAEVARLKDELLDALRGQVKLLGRPKVKRPACRPMTAGEARRARELAATGMPASAIARQLKRSSAVVSYALRGAAFPEAAS